MQTSSAAREKQKVLLFCAAVIPLFTFADTLSIGHFSPGIFSVRILWSLITVAMARMLSNATPRAERVIFQVLALMTSFFFCLLVELTGGTQSSLFHWILAMPILVAVVVQEHPRSTLLAGATMLAGGVWIQVHARTHAAVVVQWTVQAGAMSALAYYASTAYRRLHDRETALQRSEIAALERAKLLEGERVARVAAEQAVRARDDFLSAASHELRTPLTSIKLQIANMGGLVAGEGSVPKEKVNAKLDLLRRQIGHLEGLTATLLDVPRLSGGKVTLEWERIDLSALGREVAERLSGDAARAGCALTLRAASPVPGVWDRLRIDQVLTNLLINAFKFGGGKPVGVTVCEEGAWAVIEVADQGIGIEERDRERIFEQFERAASSNHFGGLGLGLWICRQIIQAHGGQINVSSVFGEGSTFRVRLPRDPASLFAP